MEAKTVELLPIVESIHADLSESLCEEVFREERDKERRRRWSLHKLVEFWVSVVLRAPQSLTQALEELRGSGQLETTDQAFFERCQGLSSRFFCGVYERFVKLILPKMRPVFCSSLRGLLKNFPSVFVMDGSRLDAIAHQLKILRHITCAVLPGCLFMTYDLFRGIAVRCGFSADAGKSELHSVREAIESVQAGSLIVGDRLFCKLTFFEQLRQKGLWGLVRRWGHVKVKRLEGIRVTQIGETILEEFLAEVGGGSTAPKQKLRVIRRRKPHFELLTNVLESERLPAQVALALYAKRWSIETLFQELKCVLNLHSFYAANPNAIAMQVYASAIVHTALRKAQADIASETEREPEQFSTQKLFTRLSCTSIAKVVFDDHMLMVQDANPGVQLKLPDPTRACFSSASVDQLLAATGRASRSQHRRRRVCRKWKTFRTIIKARRFLN